MQLSLSGGGGYATGGGGGRTYHIFDLHVVVVVVVDTVDALTMALRAKHNKTTTKHR